MKSGTITMSKRRYSELVKLCTFQERFDYLNLNGRVGDESFGHERYLNQRFYQSPEWRRVRDKVIVRDSGFDLAHENYIIGGKIIVHHINPITRQDLIERSFRLFDMENLISVSHNTHEAIHFGSSDLLLKEYVPRRPNDTCPWR